MLQSGTNYSAESTKVLRIKCAILSDTTHWYASGLSFETEPKIIEKNYILITCSTMHARNVLSLIKYNFYFMCYFFQRADSHKTTTLHKVFPCGDHYSAESTEAMQIKYLAQRFNVLALPRIGSELKIEE